MSWEVTLVHGFMCEFTEVLTGMECPTKTQLGNTIKGQVLCRHEIRHYTFKAHWFIIYWTTVLLLYYLCTQGMPLRPGALFALKEININKTKLNNFQCFDRVSFMNLHGATLLENGISFKYFSETWLYWVYYCCYCQGTMRQGLWYAFMNTAASACTKLLQSNVCTWQNSPYESLSENINAQWKHKYHKANDISGVCYFIISVQTDTGIYDQIIQINLCDDCWD